MARVCMIAYSEYVSDARIRREAESLAERGDHVDCICLPFLDSRGPTTLNGVNLFPVGMRKYRGESNWRYALSYAAFFLRSSLRVAGRHIRNRYDVVQIHTMPDFLVFCALIPRLLGAGVVLDVHDLMPELYMSKFELARDHWLIRMLTWLERSSIAFADKAVAVHDPHLDVLVSHGSSREKFSVLLNTPDPKIFVRSERPVRGNGFRLVYHGTLSRRHGLELALHAAALAAREISDFTFSIIGEGDDLQRLMGVAAELGLSGIVEFSQKSVPVSDLPRLLESADLGVVPFKSDNFTRYMLPVKILEYVALGIPVIATRTPTIEKYFSESMIRYISGEDVQELAAGIVELQRNPERRSKMVTCASEFTRRYNWSTQKAIYHGLIGSLVGPNRRARPQRFLSPGSGSQAQENPTFTLRVRTGGSNVEEDPGHRSG